MATPKPPGQRRRRNAGQGQWQELPAGGRKGEIPEPRTDRVLGPIAKRYWDTLWTSSGPSGDRRGVHRPGLVATARQRH